MFWPRRRVGWGALDAAAVALCTTLLLGVLGFTCVAGGIPPSKFNFINTVVARRGEPSGWKVAQVVITLNRMTPDGPVSCVCQIEVGVPEISYLGSVDTLVAQQSAAAAADGAARFVLRQEGFLSATACDHFQAEMERLLNFKIPGARVSDFIAKGIVPTSFP